LYTVVSRLRRRITFPTYYAHNLLIGTLRMEIGDSAHIVCKATGLRADIDFHQKSMFGGSDKLNSASAVIRRMPGGNSSGGEELFHIAGHWDKSFTIAPAADPKAKTLFLDVAAEPVR
jgi:hypothetical protein